MTMLGHEFESRIAGIPCLIQINDYDIREGDSRADNRDDFYGYAEVFWTVLDRNGRKAPWLEKKLKQADYDRIDEEAIALINDWAEDQRNCYADYERDYHD